MIKLPPFIKPGDTLGFAAPSFGASIEPYITRFASALAKLEARGYRTKVAPSAYKGDGIGISTDPASAAADLEALLLDDEVDAVLSVGGGELMNETISRIDFGKLGKAAPKWFMGYSDNTNFLIPMATLFDVPGIYGPCAPTFGKPWEAPEEMAFGLLEGTALTVRGHEFFELPYGDEEEEKDPLAMYRLTERKRLRSFAHDGAGLAELPPEGEITMKGMLLGGCLDILQNLLGTPYEDVKGFCRRHGGVIWVLEACDLNVMSIRRTIWHLKEAGWFGTAAGFVIGRPLAAFRQEMMGLDSYHAVLDVVEDLGVPVVMDADVGHVAPMMPLILGCPAEVRVSGDDITVTHMPEA